MNLSKQNKLDGDPKAIKQMEFLGQLKNLDDNDNAVDVDGRQSMFVSTILEKIKKVRLIFSQGNVTAL